MMDKQRDMEKMVEVLIKKYGKPKPFLVYSTVFEFLVATILSAQCTDKMVNKVTAELFPKCNKPEDFVNIKIEELEMMIKSTGFYRNKALNIKKTSEILINNYGGEVPSTMKELLTLPGVGRKTANVILGHYFEKNVGVVVDTHVKRISKRLGLTDSTNPDKVERDLIECVPEESRTIFSDLLIMHGRAVCKAGKPKCSDCIIKEFCRYIFLVLEKKGEVKK